MKLLTKTLAKKLPKLYSTEGQKGERKIALKFFTPDSHFTWYILEGEELPDGDYEFFCLTTGILGCEELGYVRLSELQKIRGGMGLPLERDYSYDDGLTQLIEAQPDFCKRLWG